MDWSIVGTIGHCGHCKRAFIINAPNHTYCTANCSLKAARLRRRQRDNPYIEATTTDSQPKAYRPLDPAEIERLRKVAEEAGQKTAAEETQESIVDILNTMYTSKKAEPLPDDEI